MPRSQRLAYLGCSFSIGVFSAFNNYTMALWLNTFITSYILISLLSNTKSLEGAVVSPLAGFWSDRVWAGWLGRRRPFILAGGLLSALLLALTPTISRFPMPVRLGWLPDEIGRLLPLIAAIFLFTLTINLMDDVHHALLADLTEGAERNWLSALATVVDIGLGQAGLLALFYFLWSDVVPEEAFAVAGGLVALGVLITVLGIREPLPAVWVGRKERQTATNKAGLSPRALLIFYRGATVFCLVNFAYWSGVSAVLPLVSIYTRDILGANVGEAQLLPAILLLSTMLAAIPMGWLGTRYGKRRVMSAGFAVMAAAALSGVFITTKEQGAVLFLLAGVGNAATIVLRIPLLADLVPRQQMGAAAGLLAASGSVAAPLASVVAGGLSDLYGPRAIFGVMTAMTCLALVLMPGVKNRGVVGAQ
jgi:MFS family permease